MNIYLITNDTFGVTFVNNANHGNGLIKMINKSDLYKIVYEKIEEFSEIIRVLE